MKFEDFKLSKGVFESIGKLGFENPTQIQEQSIPSILEGKDVIGESATGSGKTLAFGCGVVEYVSPNEGLQALILAPTRELVEQVKDSLRKISYHKKLDIITIYGGVSIDPQIRDLKKADVVVATPGRLLDHINRRTINLKNIKLVVLDEVDRMLDMGFIDDVEKIMRECPEKRQSLFFSATISSEIRNLSNKYMNKPIKVLAKNMVDPSKLKQVYYNVEKNMKFSLLMHLLKEEQGGLSMVFCNTRRNTDFVVKNLQANKVNAIAIHGGLTQNKRIKTIKDFNKLHSGVLVCTDVAARGLHIDNVSHVYNYEMPKDPKDYIHRIGRTARAGEAGKAVNLLCEYDHENFSRVQKEYRTFLIKNIDKPRFDVIRFIMFGGNNGSRGNSQRRNSFRGRDNSRGNSQGRNSFRGRDNSRGNSQGRNNFRKNYNA